MAERRSGLGKGLKALIPVPEQGNLENIPLDRIRPNPNQPRERFSRRSMEALTESVRAVGILQPVVVRPEGYEYVLVAGERRWRAAREVGLAEIPAMIRETDEAGSLTEALIENLQRENLNPLEEAAAFQQLDDEFGMSHAEIGKSVGRSRSSVTNTLRLLRLTPAIQKALAEGYLSAGHARALLGLEDTALAEHLAERSRAEGWSVRQLEEAVRVGKGMQDGEEQPSRLPPPRPAAIVELERRLADQLGTNVSIRYRNNKGQVVLKFDGLDQLEQIYRRFFTA